MGELREVEALKDELRWAIANNEDRQRTALALTWALEVLEAVEVGQTTEVRDGQ